MAETKLLITVIFKNTKKIVVADAPMNTNENNEYVLHGDYGPIFIPRENVLYYYFIVPNLELILPEITNEYELLKAESREKEESVDTPKINKYKDKYERLMAVVSKALVHNELNTGKIRVTKQEIAGKLGIGMPTLNRYLDMDIDKFKKSRGLNDKD